MDTRSFIDYYSNNKSKDFWNTHVLNRKGERLQWKETDAKPGFLGRVWLPFWKNHRIDRIRDDFIRIGKDLQEEYKENPSAELSDIIKQFCDLSASFKREVINPHNRKKYTIHINTQKINKIINDLQKVISKNPPISEPKPPPTNYKKPSTKEFHKALESGDFTAIKEFLDNPKLNVNSKDGKGQTPLQKAIRGRNKDIVKLLLDHPDIDVNGPSKYGRIQKCPPIVAAVMNYNPDILKLLMDHPDININAQTENGSTALLYAVSFRESNPQLNRSYLILQNILLSDPRINPIIKTKTGFTPLNFVTYSLDPPVSPLLEPLDNGYSKMWLKQKLFGHRFGLDAIDTVTLSGMKTAAPSLTTVKESFLSFLATTQEEGSSLFTRSERDHLENRIKQIIIIDAALSTENLAKTLADQYKEQGEIDLLLTFPQHAVTMQVQSLPAQDELQKTDFLLKGNRGEGRIIRTGIKISKIRHPGRIEEALDTILKAIKDPEGQKEFDKKIDKKLALKLDGVLGHHFQDAENCTMASSKLLIHGIIYTELLKKGFTKQQAAKESTKLYKEWTTWDRRKAIIEAKELAQTPVDLSHLGKEGEQLARQQQEFWVPLIAAAEKKYAKKRPEVVA